MTRLYKFVEASIEEIGSKYRSYLDLKAANNIEEGKKALIELSIISDHHYDDLIKLSRDCINAGCGSDEVKKAVNHYIEFGKRLQF